MSSRTASRRRARDLRWRGFHVTALLLAGSLAHLSACASDPMPAIREAFYEGRYDEARERLLELERDSSDRQVYQLERGIVELARHEPQESERALRAARDRLDELETDDPLSWFAAVLLDDRQLPYSGADYEKVLVRAVLAVANLMHGGRDAAAYALQVLEKQQEIIRSFEDENGYNPKRAYKLVAFGSYLRAILLENDPVKLATARREFERVKRLEPDFPFADADLERAAHGKHSEKGNGVIHVIAMVGKGPFRVEVEEPVTSRVLALAQAIWGHLRKRAVLPNITAVKIPAMAYWRDNPTETHVSVDGRAAGATATVTDVELTAAREFAAMRNHIVARAVLRRAFKIAVTEGVREAIRKDSKEYDEGELFKDLAVSILGMVWTGVEQADLRCWSLLPASFQVLRLEVPAGRHELTIRAGLHGRPVGAPQTVHVMVRDGYNTYVLVQTPTLHGGPEPLTSEPAFPEGTP